MISKLKEAVTGARLRAGQMLREHRERAEERKAENAEQPGVTIPRWLIRSVDIAGWMAYAILVWFILQRVLSIAESRFETLTFTHFGPWSDLVFNWHFPLVIGYLGAAVAVPFIAKFVIPLLVSLSWRTHFWAKSWALLITVMVSFVLITGTMKVGGDAIIESERGSAVAVATIEQQRAGIESQIARKERELQALINHPNTYFSIAAGMSPEAYRRNYIDARRNDPNIERLRSALGASEDAARLRTEIAALEDQRDNMQTTAAVSSTVESERTGEIQSLIDRLNVWWLLAFAAILDICCLLLPWLKLTLQNIRARQLGLAEGIPRHRFMLNDLTENAPPASVPSPLSREEFEKRKAPMDSGYQGDTIYDERGNELVWVEGFVRPKDGKWIPGHYRKSGRRKKQEIEVEIGGKMFTTSGIDQETGVDRDGGARIASAAGAASLAENAPSEAVEARDERGDDSDPPADLINAHPEPSTDPAPLETLSEEALNELLALESAAADESERPAQQENEEQTANAANESGDEPKDADENDERNSEQRSSDLINGVDQAEPSREPETNPNRLIAAE